MTYELLICFFVGFIVGALTNRNKDDIEQKKIYDERYAELQKDIAYYRKLTRELANENAEFRRKQ